MADNTADTGDLMDQALQTGVELGAWLATEVRPQLARWKKSGDRRVRIQALLLSGIVEAKVKESDWAFLADLRDRWTLHAADPSA